LPEQIFAPGTIPAYSNYATTVAAYIVERVSGEKFDDYVDRHILQPLNMAHATFRQPLPENLKPFMSNGYHRASKDPSLLSGCRLRPRAPCPPPRIHVALYDRPPAERSIRDVQILKPETAIQMHTRQDGWPASMNAQALGFYEESRNGHRIIGHGGDTEGFPQRFAPDW